jgi:uncharacterized protein YndB with AHSA1/START domain
MKQGAETKPAGGREVVITRVFEAPREKVWRAWTDAELFKRWWGPKDFTAPSVTMDPRVGGRFLGVMRSPEGQEIWSTGVYREVEEPERLVITDSFADADGNVVPATYYGFDGDFPLEMMVTVTLREEDGKTEMTLKHAGAEKMPAAQRREMMQGWNQSFDKLAAVLAAA